MPVTSDLEASWDSLGIDPAKLDAKPDGTIRPDAGDTLQSRPALEGESSGVTVAPNGVVARLGTEEVSLRSILGEGGMGKVWLGAQRSLARDVAVKELRDDLKSPAGRAQLLREARVTGALEHPNIIPVHALVQSPEGEPLMVMKRIEGSEWTKRISETRGTKAHLETHLRILMQVCHAVHFAHDRGVLHRDLKPDNVMLGEFGEVYVVDWGIAVALTHDTGIDELPHHTEVKGIVGTIQYMAPEMVAGDGSGLCAQSDVYLLGAILHEIVTGEPRHRGEAVPQILHAAWTSPPYDYGPDVPEELAVLCNRAMNREPTKRPQSAEAFRREVESFLQHKTSLDLAEQAMQRLTAGKQMAHDELDGTNALREARFGFLQALRLWAGNPIARAGLQDVLSILIDRALQDANLTGARALLADMAPQSQPQWTLKVDELSRQVAKRQSQIAKLERDRRDADMAPSARPRRVFGIGFALAFVLVNVGLDFWDRSYGVSWLIYLIVTGGTSFAFLVPLMMLYERLFPTRALRRLSASVAVMLIGQVASFTVFMVVGLELRTALALSLFPLGTVIGAKSALIEPRMWWSALLAFGAGGLALVYPTTVFYCVAAAYAAYFIGGVLLHYDTFVNDVEGPG